MKPREIIDRTWTPDGALLELAREGTDYVLRLSNQSLMSSAAYGSEQVMATIAMALELCRREDAEPEGPVLGGCLRCGDPVVEAGPTIAVLYHVPGRRRPGSEERTADRFEWRTFSPLVKLGWPDEKVMERRRERLPEIVKQAREGAHLLCRSCAGRWRTWRTWDRPGR